MTTIILDSPAVHILERGQRFEVIERNGGQALGGKGWGHILSIHVVDAAGHQINFKTARGGRTPYIFDNREWSKYEKGLSSEARRVRHNEKVTREMTHARAEMQRLCDAWNREGTNAQIERIEIAAPALETVTRAA